MEWAGSVVGNSVPIVRRLLIGDDVVKGQLTCLAFDDGIVGDPAAVDDYTEALGVALETVTVSTTQGAGGKLVETTVDPFAIIRGLVSGGTAADTAWSTAQLLTNDTLSAGGTLITDAEVGTLDYVAGYIIGLNNLNKGHVRICATQGDAASCAVTDPFDNPLVVLDTYLRTYSPGVQGVSLTTNWIEWDNLLAGTEALNDDLGPGAIWSVRCGKQPIENTPGDRNPYANVDSETAPTIEFEVVLLDHVYNTTDDQT